MGRVIWVLEISKSCVYLQRQNDKNVTQTRPRDRPISAPDCGLKATPRGEIGQPTPWENKRKFEKIAVAIQFVG